MSSCADVLDVKGRWQAIGAQATEAFRSDGTFTAVDNQGMSVSGTYRVKGDGHVRFDIADPGGSTETIHVHISIGEDTLIVISEGGLEGECSQGALRGLTFTMRGADTCVIDHATIGRRGLRRDE